MWGGGDLEVRWQERGRRLWTLMRIVMIPILAGGEELRDRCKNTTTTDRRARVTSY